MISCRSHNVRDVLVGCGARFTMFDADSLLDVLATGKFCSGEELARKHGVSRTTIAEGIRELEKTYRIAVQRVPGRGYRLARPFHLLSEKNIVRALPDECVGFLDKIEVFRNIDSTNDYLLAQRDTLGDRYRVAMAERQLAGRGRNGRHWISDFASGIALSLGWRRNIRMADLGGLSLVAGLAVVDALRAESIVGVGLKWPNDLYWRERKLGGVLIELSGEVAGPLTIVLGVGLNCFSGKYCSHVDQPVTAIDEIVDEVDRDRITATVLAFLIKKIEHFMEDGFVDFMEDWRKADILAGRRVQVRLGAEGFEGTFLGVDERGAALVDEDGICRVLVGGEVSLRRMVGC